MKSEKKKLTTEIAEAVVAKLDSLSAGSKKIKKSIERAAEKLAKKVSKFEKETLKRLAKDAKKAEKKVTGKKESKKEKAAKVASLVASAKSPSTPTPPSKAAVPAKPVAKRGAKPAVTTVKKAAPAPASEEAK